MNTEEILEELLSLLQSQGVRIRRENLGGGGGGLCTMRGEKLFFIDMQSSQTESAGLCAEAVAQLVDIEVIYLKPEVREFIEKHNHNRQTDKGLI